MISLRSIMTSTRPSITCLGPRVGGRLLAVVRPCCGSRRCADEPVWLQHHLGQRQGCRGGSLHGSGQSSLVSAANQHPEQRLALFQRSRLDKLSLPFLPPPLAVRRGCHHPQVAGIGIPRGGDSAGDAAIHAVAAQIGLDRHHAGQEARGADRRAEGDGDGSSEQPDRALGCWRGSLWAESFWSVHEALGRTPLPTS